MTQCHHRLQVPRGSDPTEIVRCQLPRDHHGLHYSVDATAPRVRRTWPNSMSYAHPAAH